CISCISKVKENLRNSRQAGSWRPLKCARGQGGAAAGQGGGEENQPQHGRQQYDPRLRKRDGTGCFEERSKITDEMRNM
ncbi:hypothetical protein NE579_17125, partial [Intestinimonas massiliensis]